MPGFPFFCPDLEIEDAVTNIPHSSLAGAVGVVRSASLGRGGVWKRAANNWSPLCPVPLPKSPAA